jgi:hypothetical protein
MADLTPDSPEVQQATALTQMADSASQMSDALAVTAPNASTPSADRAKPDVPVFSIPQFMTDAYTAVTGALKSAQGELQGVLKKGQTATDEQKAGYLMDAQTAGQIQAMKIATEAEKSQQAREAAGAYGLDPAHPSKQMVDAATDFNSIMDQTHARTVEMNERRSVGFLSDPIQWMVNQVVLPYEEKSQAAQYADAAEKQGIILKAQASVLDSVQIANATTTASSQDMIATVQKNLLAIAQTKSGEADLKMAQLGTEAVAQKTAIATAGDNVAQKMVETQLQTFNANSEAKKVAYYTNLADLSAMDKVNRIADAKDKAALTLQLNDALTSLNIAAGTNISTKTFALMDPNQKELVTQGLAALGTGKSLGVDLAHSTEFLNVFNADTRNMPGMTYIRGKVHDVAGEAATAFQTDTQLNPRGQSWNSLKPNDRAEVLQTYLDKNMSAEMKNRDAGTGFYKPGPLRDVLPIIASASPELAKDLAPVVNTTPLAETKSQLIISAQAKRVADGKITPAQAAQETSAIFSSINTSVYLGRNMERLNMPAPTSYYAHVNIIPGRNNAEAIDLTNSAQLQASFTRAKIAAQKGAELNQLLSQPGGGL